MRLSFLNPLGAIQLPQESALQKLSISAEALQRPRSLPANKVEIGLRSRGDWEKLTRHGMPRYAAALISALSFRSPRPDLLRALDEPEWQQLLVFGDHMRLTIPLSQVSGANCPSWVRSRIDQNIADNAQRFQILKDTYAELAGVLKHADVPYVVLKGFAKSPDYISEPRHRVQSDIDLFLPRDTIHRGCDALSTIGYEPAYQYEEMPWDHLPGLRRKTSWQWRGNAYDPEMPIGVELHHCLWDHAAAGCGPADLSGFWKRRGTRRLEEITFSALSSIDNLGYIALNLLRDLLRAGIVTSQVYELAWFLHHNSQEDAFWNEWMELHDDELRRFESVSFLLAATWFHCDLPQAVRAEIERLPLNTRSWFERPATAPSPMGWMWPSKDNVWLHSSLLASGAAKRKLVFKRLFLPSTRPVNVVVAEKTANNSRFRMSVWRAFGHYLGYLYARVSYHLRFLPATLWHGFCWWRSARN